METEKTKAYRKTYKKEHRRVYSLPLFDTKDPDMIKWLEDHRPAGQYLYRLVLQDMKAGQ